VPVAPRNQSSVGQELRWFGLWLVLFVVVMTLLRVLLVPHGFNETVAIVLSGILTGIAMIALRARLTNRSGS